MNTDGKKVNTDEERLFSAVMLLNTKMLALTLGVSIGFVIFVATNWLVLKGGHIGPGGEYTVGPHLGLLGQFFIGYRVSFVGSIIGFFYGFAFGTIFGTLVGWIYNKVVELRK